MTCQGCRSAAALLLLLAAASAALAPQLAAAQVDTASQMCGAIDAKAPGRAAGNGAMNDAAALQRMDRDSGVGLIYMQPGRYRLGASLTLSKPVFGERGSMFVVPAGVTLTLLAQPDHPLSQLFDVESGGRVVFGFDTIRVFPEWFGAVADGKTDDSKAIQMAFDAAASSGAAMLYLRGNYGVGQELVFTNGATIMSEDSARFVAVKGNPQGVTLYKGGYAHKNVLPHITGFDSFGVRLLGADLASLQLQTISYCGDGLRLEANVGSGPSPSDDSSTVLDNTIWFDKIVNCRVGIAYRAGPNCGGANCVFQGNQVLGKLINGCAKSGSTAAIGFYSKSSSVPAWDSNQFNIGDVSPCKFNTDYTVFYAEPGADTAREILKIGSLGAVPPGAKIFSGYHLVLQGSLKLREQQPEGACNLRGLASLVEFGGMTTPPKGHSPIRAATQPRSKKQFNGGRSLLGNYFAILAAPERDWAPGETQNFYVYHQLATGELYQIKCVAPRLKSGLPAVDCLQATDTSAQGLSRPAVPEEIELGIINLTGKTIKKGQSITFKLGVATLGTP